MNYPATLIQTQRFKAVVGQRIGLRFDDAKLAFLSEVLQRRLKERDRDGESYLWELEFEPPNAELAALAMELTVGETYFFRNIEQFHALAEVVLPDRMRVRSEHKELRLLSAGCSSGEEAYSMAMVAQETSGIPHGRCRSGPWTSIPMSWRRRCAAVTRRGRCAKSRPRCAPRGFARMGAT